jgi:hypothetical protein
MTSKIKVDNITNQSDSNIVNKCGTTITLGASGDTIALASGASQTGFGRTGTVDWDTTPKTATFSAVSGNGYFCNTTAGAFTVNLPAGSAGAIVSLADYAGTWQTNNLTVAPNGTDKIGSVNENATLSTEGQSVTFVYVDSTQGWINTMDSTSNVRGINPFIVATGGTETTCGDYKIHTFTSPGTFCVSCAGTPAGNDQLEYLVVAGGGSGARGDGTHSGGGGGAGGFRFASPSLAPLCYPAKPLAGSTITASASAIPITVGAGGAGVDDPAYSNSGSNSIFSTITSAGGGGAGAYSSLIALAGGSGGGAGTCYPTGNGAGNTPPVSPPQGNNGGVSVGCGYASGGGGGGATAVGTNGTTGPGNSRGGPGGAGAGVPNAFGTSGQNCGSNYYFSGGGGAGPRSCSTTPAPAGGLGGGGPGAMPAGTAGTTNTGGGGGSASGDGAGSNGGSGIVIIRYKFQ